MGEPGYGGVPSYDFNQHGYASAPTLQNQPGFASASPPGFVANVYPGAAQGHAQPINNPGWGSSTGSSWVSTPGGYSSNVSPGYASSGGFSGGNYASAGFGFGSSNASYGASGFGVDSNNANYAALSAPGNNPGSYGAFASQGYQQ